MQKPGSVIPRCVTRALTTTFCLAVVCSQADCSKPASTPAKPSLTVYFDPADGGPQIAVEVNVDDPVPAMLRLSRMVVAACHPNAGATGQMSCGILHSRIGPVEAGAPVRKEIGATGGLKDTRLTAQASFVDNTENVCLAQTGTEGFVWISPDDVGGTVRPVPWIKQNGAIPWRASTVRGAMPWLGVYFSGILRGYRIDIASAEGGRSRTEMEEIDNRLGKELYPKEAQWAKRIEGDLAAGSGG